MKRVCGEALKRGFTLGCNLGNYHKLCSTKSQTHCNLRNNIKVQGVFFKMVLNVSSLKKKQGQKLVLSDALAVQS